MRLVSTNQGIELVHKNGNWLLKKELGFSPIEILVASVGACGVYVYETVLANSKIEAKLQNVEIYYQRDTTKNTQPIRSITLTFYLEVTKAEQKKAQRALSLIPKYCPVMQSLDPTIVVEETVVFI